VDYRDRSVIVTGASSGIGWVTAKGFAERGAVVVAVARREANLKRLIDECRAHSPRSHYIAGDLGQRAFAERVVDETVERHGRVDVLVNNAAITKHKQIYHVSADEAEHVMDVNFRSCLWTTFAAIPYMLREGGGFIVNVSSFAATVAPPREAIYAASKAAMSAFTEGLWNDLEGSGIHAALIVPGAIDTEIWAKQEEPEGAYDGAKAPPEIVSAAIFESLEQRRKEIVVPRRKPDLMAARFLRFALPGLLRLGLKRMDPVPDDVIERARERARRGRRLGDLGED
jgi:short-subunit dehydrogenase